MTEGKRLVKETEWARTYDIGSNQRHYESKFVRDELQVRAADIIGRWDNLSEEERIDFVRAFQSKYSFTRDDEDILEFLIRAGDENIWTTIALPLTRVSPAKRKVVTDFLRTRAAEQGSMLANYYQALAELKDNEAISILKMQYVRYRKQVTLTDKLKSFEGVIPYVDYLACCAALYRLDGSADYKHAIEEMYNHPDERIRAQAGTYFSQL